LLPRIHTQGLKFSPEDPNSRAILYEEQKFGKKRVECFLSAVQAFESLTAIPSIFKGVELKSSLMKRIVRGVSDEGNFGYFIHQILNTNIMIS